MTNKQALLSVLDGIEVSDLAANKVLLDAGLSETDDYGTGSKKAVDLCAIQLLYVLYTRPDVSEGGYTRSHPDFLRKIEARLIYLAKQHEVTEILDQFLKTPKIKNATNRW